VTTAPVADYQAIHVRDVSRIFGRRRALSRVSVDAHAGRVLGLFGPNGAGKSTLLTILATLLLPSSGEVRYGDHTAADVGDALRSTIGVLGHDLFLYPELTAYENLEFFGRLYGVPSLPEAIARALADARLTDRADDRAGGFSRGLRQRLALERALLHRPRLVLLDEPFTGLDDASAGILSERLRTLAAEGAIVIMATHDFDTAEAIVDDAVCVDRGKIWPIPSGAGTLRQRYRQVLQETAS
jgi:ABC-type multidrug transport system ATPase subunit